MPELIELFSWSSLALGFTLGCIHAFDLDHVMAVSVMANDKPSVKHCMHFSVRWALGHGGVLLLLGGLLYGLGIALPESVALLSEKLIGVLLIVFGALLVFQLTRYGGLDNLLTIKQNTNSDNTKTPLTVGMIHGLAGNAPVLAMLPALSQTNVLAALSYLLLFSIGLLASMTLFGLVFGKIQNILRQYNTRYVDITTGALGMASMAFGAFWLTN